MGDTRCSERLRKRPRVSYAQPDEEDLEIDDEGSGPFTTTMSEADDDDDDDEEFSLNGGKRKKKSLTKKCGRGKKQQAFRFMDLLGELRNTIYELTLTCAPIELDYEWERGGHTVYATSLRPYYLCPELLLLNKAIHAEAGPILYKNQFSLFDCTALWHFTYALSPTTKSWIEHLKLTLIEYWGSDNGYYLPTFHSLIGMTKLKSLELLWIEGHTHHLFNGQKSAQEFFRHASLWIEAIGREKEDKYAALELIILSNRSAGFQYDPDTGEHWYGLYSKTACDAYNESFRSELKRMMK